MSSTGEPHVFEQPRNPGEEHHRDCGDVVFSIGARADADEREAPTGHERREPGAGSGRRTREPGGWEHAPNRDHRRESLDRVHAPGLSIGGGERELDSGRGGERRSISAEPEREDRDRDECRYRRNVQLRIVVRQANLLTKHLTDLNARLDSVSCPLPKTGHNFITIIPSDAATIIQTLASIAAVNQSVSPAPAALSDTSLINLVASHLPANAVYVPSVYPPNLLTLDDAFDKTFIGDALVKLETARAACS
jgi:hypothetical protein